jgi:hypothetical protein
LCEGQLPLKINTLLRVVLQVSIALRQFVFQGALLRAPPATPPLGNPMRSSAYFDRGGTALRGRPQMQQGRPLGRRTLLSGATSCGRPDHLDQD